MKNPTLLLILFSITACGPKPKFAVGDCIQFQERRGEFEDSTRFEGIVRKILKVGKKSYQILGYGGIKQEESFYWAELGTVKVDCK